jgi:predicted transcriptional regulator
MAEREVVLVLAAEIISAHVSNNAMQTDQLPGLIRQVFNALTASGKLLSLHFSKRQQCR